MRREPAASDGTVPSLARRSPARRANATDSRDVRPSPPREDHERRRRPPQNTRRRGGGQERGEARGDGRRRRRPFLPTVSPIELFADRRVRAAGPFENPPRRHSRPPRGASTERRRGSIALIVFERTTERSIPASVFFSYVSRLRSERRRRRRRAKKQKHFAPQRAKRRASETRSSHISEYERVSPFVDIRTHRASSSVFFRLSFLSFVRSFVRPKISRSLFRFPLARRVFPPTPRTPTRSGRSCRP